MSANRQPAVITEWAGGGRVVASEVTSEELDMSMKEMSLSELAAEYLKTGDKFIFAYAKYKYGAEHWKDALDNAKEAANAR